MTLYNGRVQQLLQGVSQQPEYTRADGQVGEQINCISDIMQGLRRRPGFKLRHALPDWVDDDVEYTTYTWERGDGLEAYMLIINADGEWTVIDLYNSSYTAAGTILSSTSSAADDYITTDHPRTDLAFHTIADTTFIVNKTVEIGQTSPVVDKYDGVLVWAKRSSYGKTYGIRYNGGNVATQVNPAVVTVTSGTVNKQLTLSPESLITNFVAQLNTANYGWVGHKNVMSLNCNYDTPPLIDTDRFKWTSADQGSDEDLVMIYDKVDSVEDLPPYAPHGYQLEITGLGKSEFDNFYVKFEKDLPSDGSSLSGKWVECAAPDTKRAINYIYSPMTLKRTWTGSTPTFTLQTTDWVDRAAGDDDTNPFPSFVGQKITDVFSYQNRLGFLTEENVVMSRAFDHLNFFAPSVAQGADDDPVDSASSDNQITNLEHATVFDGDLFMFSSSAMFVHPGDVPVKPATFAIAAGTRYRAKPSLKPVILGKSLLFPSKNGNKSHIWETTIDPLSGKPVSEHLNKHCETYIPAGGRIFHASLGDTITDDVESITAHPTRGMFLCVSGGDIYVMQMYYKDNDRVQVAWHKWVAGELGGYPGWHASDERATFSDVHIFEDKVLAVLRYDSQFSPDYRARLVELDLALQPLESTDAEIFLDQYDDLDIEYNATPWEINGEFYNYRAPLAFKKWPDSGHTYRDIESWFDTVIVMSDDDDYVSGLPIPDGYEYDEGTGDATDYLYFNLDGTPPYTSMYLRVGCNFESRVRLSNPFPKDASGVAYTEEAVLDDIVLDLNNTGYLEVEVGNHAGDGYTHVINGMILNYFQYELGKPNRLNISETVPIANMRELATIDLVSDHWLGFHVSGFGYHLNMHSSGRRTR